MPDGIQATCVACLSCELVGERDGVVCSVPHPGGLLPQGDVGCIQQARVGGTERMPPHARTVEVPEGVDEGFTGTPVVPAYWQPEFLKKKYRAIAQWDDAETLRRLRSVDPCVSIDGPSDSEEMAVYVAWLNRDDFPPTEARQEDQLGDAAPNARHTLDDILDVLEREGVLTGFRRRYPRATQGER